MTSPQWIRRAVLAALPALMAPPARADARTAAGEWAGVFAPPGARLRLVMRFARTDGGYAASLDSPDQDALGLPATTVSGTDADLIVAFPFGTYRAALSPDGERLEGTFSQLGRDTPLVLTRHATGAPLPALYVGPQVPAPPYPYREVAARFDNPAAPGVSLAGTLTLPPGAGPFPAVLLIAGSGGQTRDEGVSGHPVFMVLADRLTRAGVAVLRYDKRGIGASRGDARSAALPDLASDAQAALAWLRARPEIAPARVGLLGHSEGGLIAPMIAAHGPAVAFLVLLAAPAAKGIDALELQNRRIAEADGVEAGQIDRMVLLKHQLFTAAVTATSSDDAFAKVHALLVAAQPNRPAADLDAAAREYSSPVVRYMLAYDPAPALRGVRCPVLALNGSKDRQVDPGQNLPILRAALAANPAATVEEMPGLNHLFQTAGTGSPKEYGQIAETMAPAALDLVTGWVKARTKA